MQNTFVILSAAGPHRDVSKDTREQPFWDEHAAFIDRLVDDGFILLGRHWPKVWWTPLSRHWKETFLHAGCDQVVVSAEVLYNVSQSVLTLSLARRPSSPYEIAPRLQARYSGFAGCGSAPAATSASCAARNACRPVGVPQYTVTWVKASLISSTVTPAAIAPLV